MIEGPVGSCSQTGRFAVFVNPHGGGGKAVALLETARPVFESAGCRLDVRLTERAGHMRELAGSMDFSAYDGLCLVGGDGTVHETLNGLLARDDGARIPLGVIPAGTGNSLMADLGGLDVLEAARRIVAGGTRPIDAIEVTTRQSVTYCFNMVSWGLAADVARCAEKLRIFGTFRYTPAALWQIMCRKVRTSTLTIDGNEETGPFLLIGGCNTCYSGRGMKLAPRARPDDGLLDLVMIRDASRRKLLQLFRKVYAGTHVEDPLVEYRQLERFSLRPGDDLVNVDGELRPAEACEVRIVPAAFEVFG